MGNCNWCNKNKDQVISSAITHPVKAKPPKKPRHWASTRNSVYTANREDIHSIYTFLEAIGSGHSGKAYKVTQTRNPNKKIFIVKSVSKENLSLKQLNNLTKEIKLWSRLDHPNICKYIETYDDEDDFHIVMEYWEGGELFEYIRANTRINEIESVKIIYQVIHAISHCHSKGIVHRDLKGENIWFIDKECKNIKIIDFGLSTKWYDNTLHTLVGTVKYMSPEVLNGQYDSKCDIWAIGVVFYLMWYGYYPFDSDDEDTKEIFEQIKKAEPEYDNKWVSKEANDWLKLLFIKDPEHRPEAETLLENPYLCNIVKSELKNVTINNYTNINHTDNIYNVININGVNSEFITNMKSNVPSNQFIKKILLFIMNSFNSKEESWIRKRYYAFEESKSNLWKKESTLSKNKMMGEQGECTKAKSSKNNNYLNYNNSSNNNEDDNSNNNNADRNLKKESSKTANATNTWEDDITANINKVEYTNFFIACWKSENWLSDDKLREVFNRLDTGHKGALDIDGINTAFRRTGKKLKDSEIERMLDEAGFSNCREDIKFEEFCTVVRKSW